MLGSYALPPDLRKLLDDVPQATTARPAASVLSKIKHVVILMQENRSFDHYFGVMPGVRGFADPRYPRSAFKQPDARNPDKYLLPFHADTTSSSAQALPSNSHSWQAQHGSWNGGGMNGFVTTHVSISGTHGQYTMAYFDRTDIPFQWALADAFTICDGYHSSMLGPTWPNRRPGRRARRPRLRERRAGRRLHLANVPGGADQGRRLMEGVPGGGQLPPQRA